MKQLAFVLLFVNTLLLTNGVDVYVHMMPWFESKATNNGTWGIHWTMENNNPDDIVDGQPNVASYYHPQIGPYASEDPDVIDWQLGAMKTAGIKGPFVDWPGTTEAFDYPKNKQNSEAIIAGTKRAGLQFAIVYEDNNLQLANVPDQTAQAVADMEYIQRTYFSESNYVSVAGAPLLMDFGPQVVLWEQWDDVLAPFNPKPTFLTLWNQHQQGGTYCIGEFAWVWVDYLDGLERWYTTQNVTVKIGTAYPGFQPYYTLGGWPGPGYYIDYGTSTFDATWQLALQYTNIVQICTWNDYGEGTIIEPTVEFQTTFLDIIARSTETKYTKEDREEVTEIYFKRKAHANNATMLELLSTQFHDLMYKFD